jgi:dTDP-4-amino-4,6-dideoxygalactose transaminase
VGLLRYPILVKNKAAVLQAAKRERVELGDWFVSPLHPVEAGLQRWGYTSGQCPLAEEVAAHIVNLPTHPRVSQREVQRTLGFLERMRREGHV